MRGQGVSHKQGSAFFCLTAIGSHLTASVMPTIKHIKTLYITIGRVKDVASKGQTQSACIRKSG